MPFLFTQIVSKTLLSAALVLLVWYHVLPPGVGNGLLVGWRIWGSMFLIPLVLIVASPFLGSVWIKSKMAWGLAVAVSGVAAAICWLLTMVLHAVEISTGGWCLMVAPTVNLAGLLFARAGLKVAEVVPWRPRSED